MFLIVFVEAEIAGSTSLATIFFSPFSRWNVTTSPKSLLYSQTCTFTPKEINSQEQNVRRDYSLLRLWIAVGPPVPCLGTRFGRVESAKIWTSHELCVKRNIHMENSVPEKVFQFFTNGYLSLLENIRPTTVIKWWCSKFLHPSYRRLLAFPRNTSHVSMGFFQTDWSTNFGFFQQGWEGGWSWNSWIASDVGHSDRETIPWPWRVGSIAIFK